MTVRRSTASCLSSTTSSISLRPGIWRASDAIGRLTQLETLDADQGRIVELRFYGGLTVEETAAVMDVSPATIKREWAMAKGWLFRALTGGT